MGVYKKVNMICTPEVAYSQSQKNSVFKKIEFNKNKTWPHSLDPLLSIPIIRASEKQLQSMKTVIFNDVRRKLN